MLSTPPAIASSISPAAMARATVATASMLEPQSRLTVAIQFREVPHRLFRDAHRPGPEPAGHPHPAGRGDHAPLRGQGPGARHGHPAGDDGLHLRLGVQRRLTGRLRDAHPRLRSRATPRCSPAPTRSRRRGASSTRSSTPGPSHPRPTSRTTTPARGAQRRRTTCWPARAGDGAHMSIRRRHDDRRADHPVQRADPALVGSGPQHRRDRDRPRPDLGPGRPDRRDGGRTGPPRRGADERDEPRRHRTDARSWPSEGPPRSRR